MTQSDIYALDILYPLVNSAYVISADGEIEEMSLADAALRAVTHPPLICHAKWTASRLGVELEGAFDVMELFAFIRPGRFCLPTPAGLAKALGLPKPNNGEDESLVIGKATFALLDDIDDMPDEEKLRLGRLAEMMGRGGWPFAPIILQKCGITPALSAPPDGRAAMIFKELAEIDDYPPRPAPGLAPVMPEAARSQLAHILGAHAEIRPSQSDYAAALSAMFATPDEETNPVMVLAEAGTGTGKTLGYLAPASLWADQNKGSVWVSTYTKSLQQQIAEELTRLYGADQAHKVVVRKGRENYLCLLNFEEALSAMPGAPRLAPALGLMARWISATPDGDLTGASFPAWLVDLMGPRVTTGLSDRRGECIHSACLHYQKCFVEKSIRGARQADIVIANHALVMVQAALGDTADPSRPTRLIFDEGHHVFDAADSAFSAILSAMEGAELRRWVRGAEDGRRGRARGLRKRLEELIAGSEDGLRALEDASEAARCLPSDGWRKRLSENNALGAGEAFFFQLRREIYHRAADIQSPFDVQVSLSPVSDALIEAGAKFATALEQLVTPLGVLARLLLKILDDEADSLDSQTRARLEGASRALERRASGPLAAWLVMLRDLPSAGRDDFIDWAQLDRRDGLDVDVGLHRHYLDPTLPFAKEVLETAHGVAVTSATLADRQEGTKEEPDQDAAALPPLNWHSAKLVSGASHLSHPALMSYHPSPFDYQSATKLYVVTDVARDRPAATAAAMAALFGAAGGGGLGLFTAIQRLRAVHPLLLPLLSDQQLPLYAQHIDRMNLSTLIQLFREDRHACLLGTDAVRDGVDVPGDALRLMVYDRVPWPRPDMLFKARADWQGREAWTDRITRLKLRQAFGRLIRRQNDKGVFVILDSRLPTRLTTAFPPDIAIERVGLAEAIAGVKAFLSEEEPHL